MVKKCCANTLYSASIALSSCDVFPKQWNSLPSTPYTTSSAHHYSQHSHLSSSSETDRYDDQGLGSASSTVIVRLYYDPSIRLRRDKHSVYALLPAVEHVFLPRTCRSLQGYYDAGPIGLIPLGPKFERIGLGAVENGKHGTEYV
ncbi:hypothetical protein DFH08DRAFT_808273 [Mycena albidolilacea]|uniref:Uncharacterized protein n=1 Tax=Mycena albidolilacea TaxID=1033008 RepID=A0AAD7A323_9AGAR|nr:hypothetical protein DFH08DRAFT_808273 [Mycena albidolilacea]